MDEIDLPKIAALTREGRAAAMRLRVAYMYYVENLTQNEIADRLGIGRVTVVRLLTEARSNREVRFRIEGPQADCVALESGLEAALGLARAIVVPAPADPANTSQLIGFATGMHVSDLLRDGMRIGVGWGQTLHHSLATLSRQFLKEVSVVSLLGGITHARAHNPAEFAWRFAAAVDADCWLLAAPAIVDSPATRAALMERCGLGEIVDRARGLDLALLSVGSMAPDSTSFRYGRGLMPPGLREELIAAGAVGDLLFSYFDAAGRLIEHPVNGRVMSVPVPAIRGAAERIMASGGPGKAAAVIGGCRLVGATTLVTDEVTAGEVLRLAGG
jgi:DNA-binding transcriptional regulator LsrR (DeoR family)